MVNPLHGYQNSLNLKWIMMKNFFLAFLSKHQNHEKLQNASIYVNVIWATRQSRRYAIIHMFMASSSLDHFFKNAKKKFLDMVEGSVCIKFQVSIVFRLVSGCSGVPELDPIRISYSGSKICKKSRFFTDRDFQFFL